MRLRTAVLGVIALFCVTSVAQAQREIALSVNGGYTLYADGSALEPGATVGGDFTWYVTPALGIGAYTDYSFTEVDGTKFPPNQLGFCGSAGCQIGDSTTFNIINQPVELWQYGVQARLRLGQSSSFAPYLMVGAGGVTIFLDSQQNNANANHTRFAARLGVGANLVVSESMGFSFSVQDAFFPSWRAEQLYPVREQFQNSRFPDLNPDPSELDDSVHNFVFSAALTFTPSRGQ